MGQPYIELRHRAPENRLRIPPPSIPEPGPGLGARLGETLMDQQHVGPSAALPGADGIEEHLEDSAVKDLEDVEVKDLVDLNLNLDPEDGRNTQVTSSHLTVNTNLLLVFKSLSWLFQAKKTWIWVPMTFTSTTSCCRGSLT